jgi:hypothetical protein
MNRLAMAALILNFGIAGIYGQQGSAHTTLSGTAANSTVDLGTGTPAAEYNLAGNGPFGSFTLRVVSASAASPHQSNTCSGANKLYFSTQAGEGVFRFEDGSLLTVNLTGGSDCIDLVAGHALCIRNFQTSGGTGPFRNASGDNLTLTMIVTPVLPVTPVFFSVTADISGTVSKMAMEGNPHAADR